MADETTRFKPGHSGNPGGMPKWVREVRQLAGAKSPRAIERLAELVESEDGKIAVAAATALLDRAGVSPKVTVESEVPASEQDDSRIDVVAYAKIVTLCEGLGLPVPAHVEAQWERTKAAGEVN